MKRRAMGWGGVIGAVVVVMVGAGGWYAMSRIRASVGYAVEAEVAAMPANDAALTRWLQTQPGVVGNTVHITREGRTVKVLFIEEENVLHQPGFPELDEQCRRLGYERAGKFHDSARR